MPPFATAVEHLRAELGRLDVLLQRELAIARVSAAKDTQDEFRGLVITEGEIEALAQQPDYLDERWRRQQESPGVQPLDARAAALRSEIDRCCVESRDSGVRLPLVDLADRTRLSRPEVDILLLAAAPELEPHYETLFAYIQNDITRKRPSVDLALNLISRSAAAKFAARWFLRADGPLRLNRLITLEAEASDQHPSLLRKFLKIDESVVAALLGQWMVAESGYAAIPPSVTPTIDVDDETRRALDALIPHLSDHSRALAVVRLTGTSLDQLHDVGHWVASALGRPMLEGTLAVVENPERRATFIRHAIVGGCVVALTPGPDKEEGSRDSDATQQSFWRELAGFNGVVLLCGPYGEFQWLPQNATLCHITIRPPDFSQRRSRWTTAVDSALPPDDVSRLADEFRFGRTGIEQTMSLARSVAAVKHPARPAAEFGDVLEAGRLLTTPQLRRFAVRIEPRFGWDDIVLAEDKLDQLRRIANWKRLRHRVHEGWGFGQKLSRGQGLAVMFAGPSGTGKTMAAEVLACDLGLDLFQIDLSSVVSKYVGQTEKHLDAIFREASDTQCLLFFDEADALFGKRTEVKDAHDRYANIETNFLLQRIEQYQGLAILATNMRRNLDDAFVRRLGDTIDFTHPGEQLRERIWRGHFPRADLCASDVDLPFLARQFKLTGGQIKNVVLAAAFRAAAASTRIHMLDILLAIKAELAKQGRLPTKVEFGRYFDVIEPERRVVELIGR
jgi:DNA polymerase III delta prime subunit